MSRFHWSVLLVGMLVWAGPIHGRSYATSPAGWKAGVARAKITPEQPMWMAGYAARNHPAEGTLHDLWVKVLVLEDASGNRAVVVTSDLLGFPRAMAKRICSELSRKYGLRRDRVMLTASHTHTGPVLENALYDIYPLDEEQRGRITEYSRRLEQVVVETTGRAAEAMQPVRLLAGEGSAGFAVNRRNNRAADVPEILARGDRPVGPDNHSVPVLAVRTAQGKLLAVVFGYACHATTLSFYQWSGDYPGFAQLALEKRFPGATAMFFAGCGADQNPLPRRSVELCRKYGEELSAAVSRVLEKPMRPLEPLLETAYCVVNLKYQTPNEAELKQLAAGGGYRARWAQRLLREKAEGVDWPIEYPYPVQVWKLGRNQLWVALGGEVVVDYVNRLQKTYGPSTWVAGYANDVMSYIPSRRVWEEGGYEAGAFAVYGLPAVRWQPEIEQRIVEAVDRLIDTLQTGDHKAKKGKPAAGESATEAGRYAIPVG